MESVITISSKNQITIPISSVKKHNLSKGDKLVVYSVGDTLSLRPLTSVLRELRGSVAIPTSHKKKDLRKIIAEARLGTLSRYKHEN